MAQTIEDSSETPRKPSLVATIIPLVVITVIAGGAGFGVSAALLEPAVLSMAGADASGDDGKADKAAKEKAAKKKKAEAKKGGGGDGAQSSSKKIVVVDMPAITTNLADPSDAWIRLEAAVVFEDQEDQALTQEVHQDIVGYVRTVRLYNLRGGSGYRHLLEDLEERARIRSEGRIKRVLIRSLVIE